MDLVFPLTIFKFNSNPGDALRAAVFAAETGLQSRLQQPGQARLSHRPGMPTSETSHSRNRTRRLSGCAQIGESGDPKSMSRVLTHVV